jgi:GNAT superfamily N-acetyltransferase
MKIVNRIKIIVDKVKHAPRIYCVFYADSTELLDKAQKIIRPLPEGCELVKITNENKKSFESKWSFDRIMQIGGEVWAIVNKDKEVIAWHYGTYRGNDSMFFKVKKCDFEHVELLVDEKYRRQGIGLYLLYHTVQNLDPQKTINRKLATVIHPDNGPSIKLHELIGFKKSHRVVLFHFARKIDGHYRYYNFPHYSI